MLVGHVLAVAFVAAVWLLQLRAADSSSSAPWTDVTEPAGLSGFRNVQGSPAKDYVVESIGGGCGFLDLNGDGRLDVLLVRGTTLQRFAQGGDQVVTLFQGRKDGTFVNVTEEAGLLLAQGWGMGLTVADYDNDGNADFLVTGLDRVYLFHNDGKGTFTERAAEAGLRTNGAWSTGAAFGDLDGDGHLDLYIANYASLDFRNLPQRGSAENCIYKGTEVFCGPSGLEPAADRVFRNNGDGTFSDVTDAWGFSAAAPPFYGLQVVIADYDGDGRADIFVANDSTPNYLFRNLGGGRFWENGVQAGVAVNLDGREQASMGADWGDYDNDGLLDLIVTNFSEDSNTLYRNMGDGTFADVTWSAGIGPPSWLYLGWGSKFIDYDNDGLQDILVVNGHVYPEADRFSGGSAYRQRPLLHRNLGDGTFAENGAGIPIGTGAGRGLCVGDYDRDGDLDILINHQDGPPQLLRNDEPPGNHWLQVRLEGRDSNRDGVGAVVTVSAGGRRQTATRLAGDGYLSSSAHALHFGLGRHKSVDELTVRWPNGTVQEFESVKVNQILELKEP